MKVANLIMVHKNPLQLERMIKSMAHSDFFFFVHVDQKTDISGFEYIQGLKNVYFIKNRIVCNWGGFSFVRAILNSISEILNTQAKFEFYNLMSSQDYPIKPIPVIYEFLKSNVGKSFVSHDDLNWWGHAVSRFEKYHFTDLKFRGRYVVQGFVNGLLPKRKFPLPLRLYGSSNSSWWTISSEAAIYLVEFMKQNTKLEKFMSLTWGADEFLISTILMNSKIKANIVNDNLRYITWDEGSPNPRILSKSDQDALRKSDKLFARKFDITIDTAVLDNIDEFNKTQH